MCTVCGCQAGEVDLEGHDHHAKGTHHHAHEHHAHEQPVHEPHAHQPHAHEQGANGNGHAGGHAHHHHYGNGPARAHAPGLSQARMVEIEQNILSKNDEYALHNRQRLQKAGILALNLVSSPGSGKTTLLTRTIEALGSELPVSVIEGDQQTANDANRIRATGAAALQVNTGKGCHLDGHMVGHAIDSLAPENDSVLFIENVGNLVCPAAFDLGEHHKVVILSVTEGEDKPLKYPDMFHAADLMLLNKVDLLPYLDFDVEACKANARRVNPDIQILTVSATSGEGMPAWCDWIRAARQLVRAGH